MYRDYLKLPSYELYLNCVKTKTYPFHIRARVINAYRKMAKKGIADLSREEIIKFQDAEDLWKKCTPFEPLPGRRRHVQIKEYFETKEEEGSAKAKQRIERRKQNLRRRKGSNINQNQGSRKNVKRFNSLKSVVRWTSGGKDRPSRKRKIQFVSRTLTLHLRGNKYSGGQSEF